MTVDELRKVYRSQGEVKASSSQPASHNASTGISTARTMAPIAHSDEAVMPCVILIGQMMRGLPVHRNFDEPASFSVCLSTSSPTDLCVLLAEITAQQAFPARA
jgi:hypothetical protein